MADGGISKLQRYYRYGIQILSIGKVSNLTN
jgi:hypothetical protein